MSEIKTVEVWVAVNSDGDYAFDIECPEDAANEVGGYCRVVKLTINVPLPVVPEAVVTVPEDSSAAILVTTD